jgi:hypothetical protein
MRGYQDFRLFLYWTSAVIVAGVVGAIVFVVIVDPYRLYQLVDVPGFNHVKPALDRYQEEIKLSLARKVKANVILLGNSRVEIGLDPRGLADSADLTHSDVPYNLAISGASIATARDELEYLHHIGQIPKKVVLGLDFIDFLVDPSRMQPQPPPRSGFKADGVKWKFDALFSLTSVMDAWSTLQIQRQAEAETVTPEGFNPLLEYNKYARDEGYFSIFQQRAIEYAQTFVRKPHGLQYANTGSSADLDDLRAIIALALKDKIELQMLIYPYHAQMLALFEEAGLWPAFEQWKGLMADEVAAAKRQDAGARISLWDFSGFSAIQCEPIPVRNDRISVTQWYWEAGHFKPSVGNLILARLQDRQRLTASGLDRFGMALTASNLQENQHRMAQERSICAAAAPQLFEDASHLIQSARVQLAH